ncbi:DMT family transporter [Deinococcus cellulosilyticus]|uniref:DMT family transporter n=1 Tax=Deinococcus cellulosilyticus (strain DSM 18568 / NBRC 106333 / KACC 11606 / 5516J-15) TaxID=1223518 RepID=A0A511N4H9_DEIC1|nr:DMT family transporter [Deinococcus cellulosilyticus]GEM47742.1 hypothetical protein DC3_33770 [Deinococcus cellulosilyticus NBRC 106333 = KACC 11606]
MFLIWILAVVAGALMPLQLLVNSTLAHASGSSLFAAMVSMTGGTLILFLTGRARGFSVATIRSAPPGIWLGGFWGSIYILTSIIVTQNLGTAWTVVLLITTQTVLSLLIDHFGAFGLPRKPFDLRRAVAAVLLIAAVYLKGLQ